MSNAWSGSDCAVSGRSLPFPLGFLAFLADRGPDFLDLKGEFGKASHP